MFAVELYTVTARLLWVLCYFFALETEKVMLDKVTLVPPVCHASHYCWRKLALRQEYACVLYFMRHKSFSDFCCMSPRSHQIIRNCWPEIKGLLWELKVDGQTCHAVCAK